MNTSNVAYLNHMAPYQVFCAVFADMHAGCTLVEALADRLLRLDLSMGELIAFLLFVELTPSGIRGGIGLGDSW